LIALTRPSIPTPSTADAGWQHRHDVPVHSHSEQLDLIAMCTKGLYFFSTQSLANCQQLVKSMHR
jgi:hypothetical protein